MAIRIAIANHKGGVAKSTTTLMVAEGLAAYYRLRVLVVDMDPQCSVSSMLLSGSGADRAAGFQRSFAQILTHLADGIPVQLSRVLSPKASDLIELRDASDTRRVDLIASDRALLNTLQGIEIRLRGRIGCAIRRRARQRTQQRI